MNMKLIKALSKLFTEDCVITLANGKQMKGSLDVAAFIVGACEGYNKQYIKSVIKGSITGVAIGAGIAVTGIGISEIIRLMKDKKIKITKEEA